LVAVHSYLITISNGSKKLVPASLYKPVEGTGCTAFPQLCNPSYSFLHNLMRYTPMKISPQSSVSRFNIVLPLRRSGWRSNAPVSPVSCKIEGEVHKKKA
jgi:hypothetical protein